MHSLKSAYGLRLRSMSRPARATGGAPAGARRASRSATARTRAPRFRRSSGRRSGRGSAPASAPATGPCATVATRSFEAPRIREPARASRFGLINSAGRTDEACLRRSSRLGRLSRLAGSLGLRLADEDDVALDQILDLWRPGLLRVEIGDVEPRNQLQSLVRRRDEERGGVNFDVCG